MSLDPREDGKMGVPTFEKMLRPILALSAERDITRKDAAPAMEDYFSLTEDERASRIATGATHVRNRTGWAMTFLTKGGLIAKVAPRIYRITDRGQEFLSQYPEELTVRDLEAIEGWEEAWHSGRKEQKEAEVAGGSLTPLETVESAIETLHSDLKDRLLAAIIDQSPAFFERLVLDVLLAMGYGGSRADAAEHLGRSNDEGIDGRINQDPLGLDQIVVQAKKYKRENVIDRKTIQAFVGSMTGQGVNKGVFITTSSFNANATEFVQRGASAKVVLINGSQLLDLMLRHHIGVRVEKAVEVMDLDQNYFEADE